MQDSDKAERISLSLRRSRIARIDAARQTERREISRSTLLERDLGFFFRATGLEREQPSAEDLKRSFGSFAVKRGELVIQLPKPDSAS